VGNGHSLTFAPEELERQDIDAARVALEKVHCGDFGDSEIRSSNSGQVSGSEIRK
jgi:hypothetical protein